MGVVEETGVPCKPFAEVAVVASSAVLAAMFVIAPVEGSKERAPVVARIAPGEASVAMGKSDPAKLLPPVTRPVESTVTLGYVPALTPLAGKSAVASVEDAAVTLPVASTVTFG